MAGLAAGMVALGTAVTGTVLFSFIGPGGLLAAGITALGVAASTASLSFNRDWRGVASEIKSGAVSVYEAYARVWSVEGRKAIFADIKVGIDGFIGNLKDLATWFGSAFPAAMKADCEIVKSVALYGFDVVKTAFTGFFNWLKEKVNWLFSFLPGDWHKTGGNVLDIPGFNEAYGSGGASPAQRAISHHAFHAAMGGGVSLGGGSGVPTGNTAVWGRSPGIA